MKCATGDAILRFLAVGIILDKGNQIENVVIAIGELTPKWDHPRFGYTSTYCREDFFLAAPMLPVTVKQKRRFALARITTVAIGGTQGGK